MSFNNPAFRILRRSVQQPAGEAGLWEKMSPMATQATQSPDTPELLNLNALPNGVRANPVPEVMAAAGFQDDPSEPHTVQRDLMHGRRIDTWDLRKDGLLYFLFRDGDNPATNDGNFPAATIRVPRGAIFHAETQGHGPPPHTIHWHGIEPTPINDGVGHCSMELGQYTYQWQPNAIGSYFYHCHRNTVQHFEFGLQGNLIIHPPDAFFASIASTDPNTGKVTLNNIPIGAGRDGRFRTAANLVTPIADFRPRFPGFIGGHAQNGVFVPDPLNQFPTDPHAFTVPYDVEVLWVLDDRDSTWSDFAPDARAFFPRAGNLPGIDDRFAIGFFNDFNADYWFVTGVPVVPLDGQKRIGNTGTIHPTLAPTIGGSGGVDLGPTGLIPPELNSGVSGSQIAVNAKINQTILIRCLDSAYNNARITFPVDVLIIAMDGRALGVPPFGRYNNAFLLPANTPILICSARRFDALARSAVPVNAFVKVEFFDNQGDIPNPTSRGVPLGRFLQTARIPFVIK
ncbi:Multicopper oxidase [Minicystis rosea]|nr:Multicopper oxidase [Minicystis rosea]